MTQTERIQYMEEILTEATQATTALLTALERHQNIQTRIAELEAYYTSSQWLRDYEDDCAGKLPTDLKRGVLSEDAVFDLLHMQLELTEALRAYAQLAPSNENTKATG